MDYGGSDPLTVDAFIEFARKGIKPNTSPVAARNSVAAGVLGHEFMCDGNIPKDIPELPQYLLDYFANGQQS